MMARYVDVSKAVEALNDAQVEYDEYYKGLGKAKSILLDMPIEVPEQKSGKWIYPSGIVGFGRCSECKALWDYSLITNRFFRHCPRCGAKIENSPFKDTEREEEE